MSYTATNRAAVDRLRENRDRAGILQLADIYRDVAHPDGPSLERYALDAVAWIDSTSPATVSADAADRIRVGDVLTYLHAGHELQGVVLTIDGDHVTTNLGHEVTITR
ncbi:hypothetical protein ACI3KS_05190 [Microbacterium sp. ZW T5_45]|uniref:hypothetical protein n=1 Tax=Microbacterium sp. ZW T5_45 TaxID=3378080 RepID=UPI003854DD26